MCQARVCTRLVDLSRLLLIEFRGALGDLIECGELNLSDLFAHRWCRCFGDGRQAIDQLQQLIEGTGTELLESL